jgi:HEPN domain-containing protein
VVAIRGERLSLRTQMNRTDLQQLADLRIKEARILLNGASYPGAYYLAGYAIECALKACIARRTKENDFPDKDFVNRSWTHDLEKLLIMAELKERLETDKKSNKDLNTFWAMVVNSEEGKRYELSVTLEEAKGLCDAISDPASGVLQWLKKQPHPFARNRKRWGTQNRFQNLSQRHRPTPLRQENHGSEFGKAVRTPFF